MFASNADPFARILRFNDLSHISSNQFSEPRLTTSGMKKVFVMMFVNQSVVVILSRFSRLCRTKCCSAKCLISSCFKRPGPRRVAMPMHADASSFRQAVMVYPNSFKKIASPQEFTRTNSCRVKFIYTIVQSCWFLCSRPTSHARSSKHQKTTSSRLPFFVEVWPRSITPANQFRQLFSGPNQFRMHVSRALNVAQNSFQTSHVTFGRRGTRHCQRFCRIMQVETVYLEILQDAHN